MDNEEYLVTCFERILHNVAGLQSVGVSGLTPIAERSIAGLIALGYHMRDDGTLDNGVRQIVPEGGDEYVSLADGQTMAREVWRKLEARRKAARQAESDYWDDDPDTGGDS